MLKALLTVVIIFSVGAFIRAQQSVEVLLMDGSTIRGDLISQSQDSVTVNFNGVELSIDWNSIEKSNTIRLTPKNKIVKEFGELHRDYLNQKTTNIQIGAGQYGYGLVLNF